MADRAHPVADIQEQLRRAKQKVAEQLGLMALDQVGIGGVIDAQYGPDLLAAGLGATQDGILARLQEGPLLGRHPADGRDRLDPLQGADHLRPDLVQAPFVIEESAPGEHALAELSRPQPQRRAQRLQLLVHRMRQKRSHHAVGGAMAPAAAGHHRQPAQLAGGEIMHPPPVCL